ncbi:MAG TPA: nitrite reductase small subunit NirD [Usitatibacter sp.]|nr:nitrite reductase small subunit NirD [Usitatibacter sp.]
MTTKGAPSPWGRGHVRVCRLEDIPRLGARRYARADGPAIAIFRTADDAVFALKDECPHKGGPLSQGIVFGQSVACPLHNWCIDLASGQAAAPDVGCAERFAVAVAGGDVILEIGDRPRSRPVKPGTVPEPAE